MEDKVSKIISRRNPLIKQCRRWKHKTKERVRDTVFIVEGAREISRGLDAGWTCKYAFFYEEGSSRQVDIRSLRKRCAKICPTYDCSEHVYSSFSVKKRPDGAIAVFDRKNMQVEIEPKQGGIYVVAESVEKGGNLGAIVRTVDAFGIDGVIITNRNADPLICSSVRNSMGSVFKVKMIEKNNQQTLEWLKKADATIVITELNARSVSLPKFLKSCPDNKTIAIVLGKEYSGVSAFWKKNADVSIMIPMAKDCLADSLNVGAAASVVLYSFVASKGFKHLGYDPTI